MVEGDSEVRRKQADDLIGAIPQPADNAAGQELIDRRFRKDANNDANKDTNEALMKTQMKTQTKTQMKTHE